jgi:hypothetical protein
MLSNRRKIRLTHSHQRRTARAKLWWKTQRPIRNSAIGAMPPMPTPVRRPN